MKLSFRPGKHWAVRKGKKNPDQTQNAISVKRSQIPGCVGVVSVIMPIIAKPNVRRKHGANTAYNVF